MSETQENHQANVDPAEIARFNELASRWWDPQSEFKPLHDINPLRLEYIDENSPLATCDVIDVGCGGGILAESMAVRDARVTGIDMGDAALTVARLHLLESGAEVSYVHTTAEAMAEQNPQCFDVVTCMEMLEHVPDPSSVIQACATLARPGGHVYFSTINRNPKAYMLAILGAEYLLRLLPRGTHDYARFIRPSEMDSNAREAGLELVGLIGMSYNPLTRRYWLDNDVDVNYIAHYKKPDTDQ